MSSHDDDWRPLSPQEFRSRVEGRSGTFQTVPPPAPPPPSLPPSIDHDLERELHAAQEQGLAPNLQRQIAFLGPLGHYVELQALAVHVRLRGGRDFEKHCAAHASSIEEVVRLAAEADESFNAQGVYILHARIKPGVETRHSTPGRWFDLPKGGGTTDSDVEARLVLAVDFDVKRPSNTSATEEEMERSAKVALQAWSYLEKTLGGVSSLAYLHSGNGRQIHIALDGLTEEAKPYLAGILTGLAGMFNTEHVQVDEKLIDAKRILPACGTHKKKGVSGIKERPHRRTAIIIPSEIKRLSLEEVRVLTRTIWMDSSESVQLAIDRAVGVKSTAAATGNVVPVPTNAGSPINRVNDVDPQAVAEWLGIYNERHEPVCPGCGETSGVAILRRGLKCHHNRCSNKGVNGFRSVVDLVMEVKNLPLIEAARAIGDQFGIETNFRAETAEAAGISPSSPTVTPSSAPAKSKGFEWISTNEIFAPLPPTQWLVQDIHLVRGRPTLIAGYGFSGKSLMVQQLAIALAAGAAVWGKYKPSEPFEVRHLDYEQGRHATLKRYQRLALGHGIDRSMVGDRIQVCVFPDVYLDSKDAQDAYARAVEGVHVVVLDALRGATPSLDENDSTIRRCIDNLTRVSEKTGTAFLILHHAGKSRGDDDGDPRKVPRGSSAIFDACGCVYTVDGEQNKPKKVHQTKAPAEAEGGSIPSFFLSIEDVEVAGSPTAGLRVVYRTAAETKAQTGAAARFDALKDKIIDLVMAMPGELKSLNAICNRIDGGSKDQKLAAIRELEECGKLSQPLGQGTPYIVSSKGGGGGGGSGGPDRSEASSDRSGGPAPLRGGPTGGSLPPPPPGDPPGPTKAELAAQERARQAGLDADELGELDPKEWKAHKAAKGWGQGRYDAARAIAQRRRDQAFGDAQSLQLVKMRGEDPGAWATEHGWLDERIRPAIAAMEMLCARRGHTSCVCKNPQPPNPPKDPSNEPPPSDS